MATSEETVQSKLKLYSYWQSSCAWRVRIALNFKGLDYEYVTVNLLKGDHLTDEYKKLNPLSYVPVLVDEEIVIADSFAIIMVSMHRHFIHNENSVILILAFQILLKRALFTMQYLEEKYPQHALLPQDLQKRALNYQAANIVASNIQPFQNLAVAKYIEEKLGSGEKLSWTQHHIKKGFAG
ncbi:Glutathione S-transferase 2 [Bienertia sinuspersici]